MSVQTVQTMAIWVEENIAEHPTLGEMSAYVGYSPWYCSTRFREVMGVTFKQYLARCRLRSASGTLGGRKTGSPISLTAMAIRPRRR